MALSIGTRIGPYEITGALGAGGMGEVYRATDTNLSRQVAIKVLPEAFTTDTERLARFEREAKTLALLDGRPWRVEDVDPPGRRDAIHQKTSEGEQPERGSYPLLLAAQQRKSPTEHLSGFE